MPRPGHQARLGRMLELPVARPLPVQIPAVGLDELDDLADRHSLAQRRVSGIGIRVQRSSLPVTLQGVLHLRRLTQGRWAVSSSERDLRCPSRCFGLKRRLSGCRRLAGSCSIHRTLPRATRPRGRLDRCRDPSSRAVGAHSNRPLLGQHGAVAQSEVAGDALVDAAELIGTLRCCPGNTPERPGSLPMSLVPLRDCLLLGVIQ